MLGQIAALGKPLVAARVVALERPLARVHAAVHRHGRTLRKLLAAHLFPTGRQHSL